MGDFTYRTRDEVDQWKTRCPSSGSGMNPAATTPLRGGLLRRSTKRWRNLWRALREAEQAPWPEAAAATRHVYCEERVQVPAVPAADARQTTFVEATREALEHEMGGNPRVFVLGEGIGRRGGNFRTTEGLFDLFGPSRLCDTPISERGFVGLGCGAAMTGSRPVIDFMFIDFINDAFGELVNQIAKMQYMSSGRLRMPILLRGCIGIGHSAATHQSGNYYSIYSHIPGLRVVVPSTPYDAKGLFFEPCDATIRSSFSSTRIDGHQRTRAR